MFFLFMFSKVSILKIIFKISFKINARNIINSFSIFRILI